MATTKSVKKTTTKRAPAKRTAKSTTVRRVSPAPTPTMKSFRVTRQAEPFFTFRITHQTFYWLALALIVLALGVWVVGINDRVQRIYDQIDSMNQINSVDFAAPSKTKR